MTFDVNTISAIVVEMAEAEESHAGVVFVSMCAFTQNNYGALARVLAVFWRQFKDENWTNRVAFFQKAGS